MDSYADHMFTQDVRAEQDRVGMGDRYAKTYANRLRGPLDEDARAFIETRDSFYMASVGATGWPYVQHRGGPAGFLKVLGPERIGFGDYLGNKQFISRGNTRGDDRVSLILMDYPRKARLKLIGHATFTDADDDGELAARLATEGAVPAERLVTIDVVAMDWNCPKYITPRLTEAEINTALAPRMQKLTDHITALEARLTALDPDWREA
ncbi:pyridoxamine 5'-phosphate oxidase family protein [Hasllibacter sp. MH4015]|uniref:pyridoxamine 5'-phosphate oxidase family protein n=1 Tax=Hasllibacter sp. MH4015 TaxID=2854029 RepID=UPI001CD3EDA5|nr:pyridoxamine 5'-phosphate oxidase family protein [Hasllibacter sp. MH4015]